jgi:hypothetical protein
MLSGSKQSITKTTCSNSHVHFYFWIENKNPVAAPYPGGLFYPKEVSSDAFEWSKIDKSRKARMMGYLRP